MATVDEMLARGQRGPARDVLDAATARVVKAAEKENLVDVVFARSDSPFGELLIASTPKGVVEISLPGYDQDETLEWLAGRVSSRVLEVPGRPAAGRRG